MFKVKINHFNILSTSKIYQSVYYYNYGIFNLQKVQAKKRIKSVKPLILFVDWQDKNQFTIYVSLRYSEFHHYELLLKYNCLLKNWIKETETLQLHK